MLVGAGDDVGGAAVSAQAFKGVEARLSRYSYLVSLLPQRIIDDLGLDIRLARRRYSSYTPVPGDPRGAGLLVDKTDAEATAASFAAIGAASDAEAFTRFYASTAEVARSLWPTVTEPLLTRSEAKALVGESITLADAARIRVNVLADMTTRRLTRLATATGKGNAAPTYGRNGRLGR